MRAWFRLLHSTGLGLLLLGVVGGCGSDEANVSTDAGGSTADSSVPPAAPSSPAASSPAPADPAAGPGGGHSGSAMDDPMVTPSGGHGGDPTTAAVDPTTGMDASGGGFPGDYGSSQPSKFPKDFADWKPDDYRGAARSSDRRLIAAIDQLVANTPGDQQTAALLAELLTIVGKSSAGGAGTETYTPGATEAPGTTDPATNEIEDETETEPDAAIPGGADPAGMDPSGMYPGSGGGSMGQSGGSARELVRAIINGLVRNDSAQAWQTLTAVVGGQVKTAVDDRALTDWVLESALDNYRGENHPTHNLLETALKNPASLNAARSKELPGQVSAVIAGTAAAVMDRLMGVPAKAPPKKNRNGSGGAGGEYMGSTQADPYAGSTSGGGAAAGIPGLPPPPAPPRPLTDQAMQNAMRFLWRTETVSQIENNVRGISSLGDGADTLALAGSLPTDDVRKTTFELLESHWEEGALPLIFRHVYQSSARDPGLIVLLKQLPRVMPQGPLVPPQQTQQPSKSQREALAKQTWMAISGLMIQSVIERMNAAAKETPGATPPELPFKLHRDAKVVAARELNWPADVADKPTGVVPPGSLKLQYVQMEISPQELASVFQHYKKSVRRSKDYAFFPTGGWIDGLSAGEEPGSRRSIDVLFMPGKPAAQSGQNGQNPGGGADPAGGTPDYGGGLYNQPGGGAGQQNAPPVYNVEVLIVEIADPKLAAKE